LPTPHVASTVLIVGAGAAGLTLANDLLSRHVQFRIIDQSDSASTDNQTVILHARTLEQLSNLGFADSLVEAGLPLRASNIYAGGKKLAHLDFAELDSPYKFILALSKARLEAILADNLKCADITVERGSKLVDFVLEKNDGVALVNATIESGDDFGATAGSESRFKFLVGCDGATSVVREKLHLPFEESAAAGFFASAELELSCNLEADEMHAFFDEHGALVLIPVGGNHWSLLFEAAETQGKMSPKSLPELNLKLIAETIRSRAGKAITFEESKLTFFDFEGTTSAPQWQNVQEKMTASYQKENVFLAGVACHEQNPLTYLGLSVGIGDVLNLGWKLGLASLDLASDELLATYSEERRACGVAFLKGAEQATKTVPLKSPVAKSARHSLLLYMAGHELVQQRILANGSLSAVSYRGLSLTEESHRPQVESIGHSLFPIPFKKATGEMPGIGAWLDFSDAARAGDYAPDAELDDYGFRLSHHIGSPRFKLLLFDGYEASELGYKQFYDLEHKVASKFCDWVDIYVVVPFEEGEKKLPNYALVIHDHERYLHEYYGASSECLYLIRPDGYIAFKGQPALYEPLEQYLTRVFKASLV
jgi:2-polyprenyl-6-methoxyphenol hydroxylase-like FAD-dependent oxidoreductase